MALMASGRLSVLTVLTCLTALPLSLPVHAADGLQALSSTLAAEFALSRGRPDEAVLRYRQQALLGQDNAVMARALRLLMQQQDYAEALTLARYWVKREPQNLNALFFQTHLALRADAYPLAAESLNIILQRDPQADLNDVLRDILPSSQSARERLLSALQPIDHRNNFALILLEAGLMAQTGRTADAIDLLDKTLTAGRLRPLQRTQLLSQKVMLLNDAGQTDQAMRLLDQQIRQQPGNRQLQLLAIRSLIKAGQSLQSLPRLDALLRRWPQDTESLLLAGLIAIDHQQPARALDYLTRLHRLDPNDPQSNYFLGLAYERMEQPVPAIAAFRRVQEGPRYREARQHQAQLLTRIGQAEQAISELTAQRVDHPEEADFLYLLQAQLLREQNRHAEARALLDQAIQRYAEQPQLWYARLLLLSPEENELRIQTLDRLLELDADNPIYLNAYAYHLSRDNSRLEDARRFAEQANLLAPNQPAILDTLGFVALRQGKLTLAISTLRRAYDLAATPGIGEHLLDALRQYGQLAEHDRLLLALRERFPDTLLFQQRSLLAGPTAPAR